jgi:tRNA(Ile)-lysidine synthetase-like protein
MIPHRYAMRESEMTVAVDVQREVESALNNIRHPRGRPIIVAVSGGVDSQVLAHALVKVVGESGSQLCAVHVDHGLREKSSDDARRVVEFCRDIGMDCEVRSVDVADWDKYLGQGIESAARAARYAALGSAAIDHGSDTIATGHTLDDQAETVLLRLMAGSGLEGVGGMDRISRRTVSLEPGAGASHRAAIFRPLLSITREQVEAYAREHALVPIEDETNEMLVYRRNQIRKKVLPPMEQIEPAVKESICRTATLLRDDARFINDTVDEMFADICAERSGVWMIERQQFRLGYEAIQRRILYRILEPLLPPGARITLERVDAVREAAVDGGPGKIIELVDDLIAYIDYDRVAIGNAATLESDLRRLSWIPLVEPGTEIVLSGQVDIELGNGWRVGGEVADGGDWVLRTRRDGDRLRDERGRLVKLQDWLVDRKVPRYVRDWLPVVARDGEIRWIIGIDMTEFNDSARGVNLHLELNVAPKVGE